MKRFLKKSIFMIVGCMLMLGLSACGKSVDLNDYVEVQIEGYDGYGVAKVVFDSEKFAEDHSEMEYKGKDADMYSFFYDSAAEYVAKELVHTEVEDGEELSNGDSVEVTWDCDDDAIKELTGYVVKYENITVEVEGLEAVPTFDPFEGLEVQFGGVGPEGTAVLVTDAVSKEARKLSFEIDMDNGLSNGDVVTVKVDSDVSLDDADYYMELCGGVPETLEKQYTVEGLSSYVVELSQIPEDLMDTMDQQAREIMEDHAEVDWSESEELVSMELLGNYWLTPKRDDLYVNNALFFVYKINVINEDAPEGFDYYYYTLYRDIVCLADGTVSVDLDEVYIPEGYNSQYAGVYGEAFVRDDFWYLGYEDLETLYENCVTVNRYEYDCISTVELAETLEGQPENQI